MRRFALLALALSLLVHGVFVLLLWLVPADADRPAGGAGDGDLILVVMDDLPPREKKPLEEPPPPVPVLLEQPQDPAPSPGPGPVVRPPTTGTGQPPPSPARQTGYLPAEPPGRSVVYLLDHSLSMGLSGALTPALGELRACVASLPPTCKFQVIPYNLLAEPLLLHGRQDLVRAEPAEVRRALLYLDSLRAEGGTHHARAIQRGLLLRPDALYLITDSLDLPEESVAALTYQNQGRTAIHVLELVRSHQAVVGLAATRLTERNGGTYRRIVLP